MVRERDGGLRSAQCGSQSQAALSGSIFCSDGTVSRVCRDERYERIAWWGVSNCPTTVMHVSQWLWASYSIHKVVLTVPDEDFPKGQSIATFLL